MEGRNILNNIFMAQEGLGWAEESNQDLVLLLLDFEKTFDRIEWDFLFKALGKLGFSPTWVHWVAFLYRDATSAIKVNGVADPDFQLARSVRQDILPRIWSQNQLAQNGCHLGQPKRKALGVGGR